MNGLTLVGSPLGGFSVTWSVAADGLRDSIPGELTIPKQL